MKKIDRIARKLNNFLFDHYIFHSILKTIKQLTFSIIAAAIFAFGFCCFASPSPTGDFTIVTGGFSGLAQNVALILEMIIGKPVGNNTIQSVSYFVLNLPLTIFAFIKIGKRFSIFTLINVLLSSVFISLFSADGSIGPVLASAKLIEGSIITRVLMTGVCIGLSSAIAFRGDISCGGIDVISYYFALKKSTSVGKYGMVLNAIIVTSYCLLLTLKTPGQWVDAVVCLLFSIIYLMVVKIVVDVINLRNKKVQLQFFSVNKDLGKVLIANFPHAATQVEARGVYSNSEKYVYYMIVSSMEVNKVIELAKKVDLHVFITVTPLAQVYGKFFIKPIE